MAPVFRDDQTRRRSADMNGIIARRIVRPVEQDVAVPVQAILAGRATKGGK
jgi:hypothetical protein